MSSVDERVVAMKMDYASFDKGVSATTKALESLKKALSFDKEAKGLNDLDAAGKKFSLVGIADGVDSIVSKFSALSIIGITALTNIANKAVNAGLTIAKSLTIDPIKAGFDEYELKMGSIQTILANTARYGTSLDQVTGSLEELNKYADKTIYNFGDMTKNIGLFTNAGIRVEDATSMIKGFSNEAAASGTSAQGAAGAAYQLSQALSAGTIRLMDWRSLTNVGMGNKNMQNGLIEIADAMGTLTANSIDAATVQGDFNGSLEKNWLSADVMSTYLKIMAGEMDAASMSAMGLSDAQIAAFQQQAATAEDAATKVRTWTQLIGTLQESVGSGWSETFDILIGDFNSATDLWTGVNNKLGPIIDAMSDVRNKIANDFVKASGRDAVIGTLSTAFDNLMSILRWVKLAFQDIFPPVTGQQIADMAKKIQEFVKSATPSLTTLGKIREVFRGIFAVLDIGRMIIVGVFNVFSKLFGAMGGFGGSVLDIAANLGTMLVLFRNSIKYGTGLNSVFDFLGRVLAKPVELLGKLGAFTANIFTFENFRDVWQSIAKAIASVGQFLAPAIQWIKDAFSNIKSGITEFFKSMDFNVLLGLLNLGALGTVVVLVKKGIDKLKDIFNAFGEGGLKGLIFGNGGGESGLSSMIKDVFGALTDSLGQLQATLKSAQILAIAIAIGILAASLTLLSTVDEKGLYNSLAAMSVMFMQLSGALIVMDKFTKKGGVFKMAAIGGAMMGMATAMLILSAAVKVMSSMDWNELARGLAGVAVGLGLFVAALKLLDGKGLGLKMMAIGTSMILMSTGILILSFALKIMASMSWEELGKGAAMLVVIMASMVAAGKLAAKGAAGGGSMILMGISLLIVAGALKAFASMSWDEIGRAMTVFAGSMAIMVGALLLLDLLKNAPVGAATMIAMAVAITILMVPIKAFAKMSWDEIGRSMTVLAGSLLILAGAMFLMGLPPVLLGAIGIVAAAAALMMLAPAMKLLGTMSWDDIGRGLTVLAGALVILALGGVLLIPAIPAFLGLGVALLLIGVATLAAGQGVLLFSAGITALAAASTIGAEAIKMAVMTLIDLIPMAMAKLAEGIIQFAVTLAEGAKTFTEAMVALMLAMLEGIKSIAPQIIDTMWILIQELVNKIVEGVPFFVDSAMTLMTNFLNTLANRIPELAAAGTNVIVAFVTAIGDNAPKVADAAAKTLVKFINGIADAITNNIEDLRSAGRRLSDAIVDGMTGGLSSRIGELAEGAANMANNALNAAKNMLGINSPSKEFYKLGAWSTEGLAVGLTKTVGTVVTAGKTVGSTLISAVSKSIDKLSDELPSSMSLNPVITPVLDLTGVKSSAESMNGMFGTRTLNLDASYASANMAYDAVDASQANNESDDTKAPVTTITYIQNNNSPKTLSEIDIYRRTKNQLSTTQAGRKV